MKKKNICFLQKVTWQTYEKADIKPPLRSFQNFSGGAIQEDWHARNHFTKSPQLLLGEIYQSQKRYKVARFVV